MLKSLRYGEAYLIWYTVAYTPLQRLTDIYPPCNLLTRTEIFL